MAVTAPPTQPQPERRANDTVLNANPEMVEKASPWLQNPALLADDSECEGTRHCPCSAPAGFMDDRVGAEVYALGLWGSGV